MYHKDSIIRDCTVLKSPVLAHEHVLFSLQLSLSAASPIYRGHLSDLDTRWTVISQSVDDRTEEERGLKVRAMSLHLMTSEIYITVTCN